MTPESNQMELLRRWEDGSLVGRRVRYGPAVRTVVALYKEEPLVWGGGVRLDRPIVQYGLETGFVSWNIGELWLLPEEGEG